MKTQHYSTVHMNASFHYECT